MYLFTLNFVHVYILFIGAQPGWCLDLRLLHRRHLLQLIADEQHREKERLERERQERKKQEEQEQQDQEEQERARKLVMDASPNYRKYLKDKETAAQDDALLQQANASAALLDSASSHRHQRNVQYFC